MTTLLSQLKSRSEEVILLNNLRYKQKLVIPLSSYMKNENK